MVEIEDLQSDWLVIETYHERYAFSTEVYTFMNKKLSEVANEVAKLSLYDLELCNVHHTHCKADLCCYDDFDGYGGAGVLDIGALGEVAAFHIESYLFLNLKEEWEGEYCWGATNKKFGLLDIKEK